MWRPNGKSQHHTKRRTRYLEWRFCFARAKTFHLFMTRIGEGYNLSPSRNYTTFPALTGLAHSSRAKYRYNESLLGITNLTVKIQKPRIQRVFI